MFSSGSFRSISLATVTPSLVIVGDPYFLSRMTLRPLGPSVTFTASASWLMPHRRTPARCALFRIEHREHFVLAHDEVFLAIEPDVLSRVLPEENRVACLHVERHALGLLPFAEADSDDLALLRLFFGAVGNDDSADFLFTFIDALDDD